MRPLDRSRAETKRLLLLSFAIVVIGCLAVTSFALARTIAIERHATFIVQNTLASIRLVARIDHDVAQRRLLLERHIYVSQPADMAYIEGQIAKLDADLDASMKAYEPWATLPGERETWEKVKAELQDLKAPVERALDYSRANRDTEARDAMQALAGQFDEVRANVNHLIAINDRGASESLATISAIRRELVATFIAIGLITLFGTVMLGRWSMREVVRREVQATQYARILEERNHDLDAFAGHVAHDLRGPLATIGLAATQLSRVAPEQSGTTDLLRRGVRRMEALIDDLLSLARVEAARGSCDPARVSSQIKEEFAGRVEREKGTLRVAVAPATVRCSEGLLQQALANLTENAVKYRRREVTPEIAITGTATSQGYELRVSDNGVGMSSEDAARMFEPFYRSQRTRELPGTGLGLAIVKRVVDSCGGAVDVTTRLGQGTTFVVHLPLAAESGAGGA